MRCTGTPHIFITVVKAIISRMTKRSKLVVSFFLRCKLLVDESFYSVWALNTAVAQNRLIENLQSAFPQMLVENPARVKQCVRIALQVQLNHYKQLEASEGVFITKPGWHTGPE